MTSMPPMPKIKVHLERSNLKHKKYAVTIYNGNQAPVRVNFGDNRYEDFTTHKDEKRRLAYIARHSKRTTKTKYHTRLTERAEDWQNPYTAGMWARWLLWEKPTIEEAKKNITKMFNIEFI